MLIDLSLRIGKKQIDSVAGISNSMPENFNKFGHLGTHFDVMDKEFSLDNIITQGKIFDISHLMGKQVNPKDVDLNLIKTNDFIFFYSGILQKYGYATKEYFSTYIELSDALIECLISKKISFIGIDMAGVKMPKEHHRIDAYCADNNVFIIENIINLDILIEKSQNKHFTVYTFPMNFTGMTGLPCRVIAKL